MKSLNRAMQFSSAIALGAFAAGLIWCQASSAQDRLPKMPGYDYYSRMSREISAAARPLLQSGVNSVVWLADGTGCEYALNGKFYRYDYASHQKSEIPALSAPALEGNFGQRRGG